MNKLLIKATLRNHLLSVTLVKIKENLVMPCTGKVIGKQALLYS